MLHGEQDNKIGLHENIKAYHVFAMLFLRINKSQILIVSYTCNYKLIIIPGSFGTDSLERFVGSLNLCQTNKWSCTYFTDMQCNGNCAIF